MPQLPPVSPVLRALAAAGLALFGAACGDRPPRRTAAVVVQRLLAEDPTQFLTLAATGVEEPLVEVVPAAAALPTGWMREGPASLVWRGELDATAVTTIEVAVADLGGGVVALEWGGPGEEWSAERRQVLQWKDARGERNEIYRFALDAVSGRWRGSITSLRVGATRGGDRLPITMVRLLGVRAEPKRLAAAAGQPWKAAAGDEWRSALLAVPGRPHRWPLTVPEDASLRFAWAPGRQREPIELRVVLARGAVREVIFSQTVAAGAVAAWNDVEIALTAQAGREVELTFETYAAGPEAGWAIWGAPLVLGRQEGAPERPLVVLVSIDTLRADRLSLYGYARPTSPHLDRWARERGAVFARAIAPSPWTLPSHASLFTGLDAFRHGANFDGPESALSPELPTLAAALRQAGYMTAAITGGGFVHPSYGFATGFDRYRFWGSDLPPADELAEGVQHAEELLLDAAGAPLFLFLHTYAVHSPYIPRQPYFGRLSRHDPRVQMLARRGEPTKENGFHGPPDVLLDAGSGPAPPTGALASFPSDLYDTAVAYMDDQLGAFLERLAAAGVLDRAVVVLTSDHGEALGEEGRWSHTDLWESVVHVPLVIAFPDGRFAGRTVERQVRVVDLMPTVLELASVPLPAPVDGRSLVPLLAGGKSSLPPVHAFTYAASTNRGLAVSVAGRMKYVFRDSVWPPVRGEELLFNLTLDPDERTDRSAVDIAAAARLRDLARQALAAGYTGLRVSFRNAGATPIKGTLATAWLGPVATKSVDLPCDCVRWRGRGRADFEIPAGPGYTLHALRPKSNGVEMSGTFEVPGCPGPVGWSTSAVVNDLVRPRGIELDSGACTTRAVEGTDAPTGISYQWQGPIDAPNAPRGVDAALAEQLRALGYVD